MNIFVVCVLQVSCHGLIQPVEVYTNRYMMWYLKKICSTRNISFLNDASFFEWSVYCPFFSRSGHHRSIWPFSVIQWTCSTHLCICACFCLHINYHNRTRNRMSNCVKDHMNNLFDWSSVQTPGLAVPSFLWVQGSSPCPCSTIFLWVQGSISWP